ncbi:pentatricopeptide repeat-containing protein At3g29290 isoform X2 [Diospyros lotus]|uniref:pentatricopeptide repeat-containing protein At3g29290 isoform X2 n=1 Tax=Diospyros lotus TaxID=55363 RepID=UPI002258C546|nr:pentatricopeptide repeat-containing protein At3g29290 isoform X2 [Diospyros lotus]
MAGLSSNSLAVTISSYGYGCQYLQSSSGSNVCRSRTPHPTILPYAYTCSGIKSNTWCAGRYDLCLISQSKEVHGLSGVPQLEFPRKLLVLGFTKPDNSSVVPWKVASVDFGLVSEEGDKLTGNGREGASINQLQQTLPPSGNLSIQLNSDFETSGSKCSKISRKMVSGHENRLYFLEERNEEILSGRILRLSRLNKTRSAMELYRSVEYSGLRPTLHACNSLISCLLRNGMLDDALRIFNSMITSETITGHTYSLVLKAISNAQGCDAALNMFEELERNGNAKRDFDAVVYNTMISVCGKVNNWVQALRIWRIMKHNGTTGTALTYRLLVCIFVRCGQNELAIDAYDEVMHNRLDPGDDAMQAIVGACCKEGKWDLALEVFRSMLNRGMKPSLITCNALINSLGKYRKVKLAFRIYSLMKSLGHVPDAYTWNALIGALYKADRHADALQLFERLKKEKNSRVLNSHLYNTCLMSCQKLGLWDKALQLLWQMEASGFPVPNASYNLVIGTCEVARKPKIALQVYEHMVHLKCAPDTFTLLSMIRCCIWGSLWHEVEEILNVKPDASLYNAAIQGMCLRGNIALATKLYKKMRTSSLKPDGKTRALMLQTLPKDSVLQKRLS